MRMSIAIKACAFAVLAVTSTAVGYGADNNEKRPKSSPDIVAKSNWQSACEECKGAASSAQKQLLLNGETREENARRLIAQNDEFKLKVDQFHTKANQQINDANRLKGEADNLQFKLKKGSPEYKSALNQFSSDLNQFKSHADSYAAHVDDFNKTMGTCHANEAAYQAQVQQMSLHMSVFHMPNIKPPHICVNLNMSSAETAHVANGLVEDQKRIVQSEIDLNKAENALALAEKQNGLSTKKAENAGIRAQKEQNLAAEFGKLKNEYDLLSIERNAIVGVSAQPVAKGVGAKTSVSAKIKK